MASCTRIDTLLQAYIDGELRPAERAIVEAHVGECRSCKGLLRSQQRSSVALFEAFTYARLDRDLTEYTLEHLPEMEHPAVDVVGLNRRAKHPDRIRERMMRLVPIAAAVLLVVLAAIINGNWPSASLSPDTLGIVAQSRGQATRIADGSTDRVDARVKSFAFPGDRFETGADAVLMLNLLGPTQIRVAADSRILIHNERKISVEKGRVFLDVAKGKRLFRVLTPMGDITVFGTSFDVHVESEKTTVVVEEGEVQLGCAVNDSVFSIVHPGELATVFRGEQVIRSRSVDVRAAIGWAKQIVPDEGALALFASDLVPLQDTAEVAGRSGFFVDTLGRPLKSIVLEWEPVSSFGEYAGYELFVYDHRNRPLFRSRIPGSVFSDPGSHSYEVENTGNHEEGLKHIFVKLVPEEELGKREIRITSLTAQVVVRSGG